MCIRDRLQHYDQGLINFFLDDHPDAESENGRYSFVSVRSILRYLDKSGGLKSRSEIISND